MNAIGQGISASVKHELDQLETAICETIDVYVGNGIVDSDAEREILEAIEMWYAATISNGCVALDKRIRGRVKIEKVWNSIGWMLWPPMWVQGNRVKLIGICPPAYKENYL